MTPEQKREQFLKRLLPGLAITVLYFVFAQGFLSEGMDEQKQRLQAVANKTLDQETLDQAAGQVRKSAAELTRMKREQSQALNRQNAISTGGETVVLGEQLAKLWSEHNLVLISDRLIELKSAQLPKVFQDVLEIEAELRAPDPAKPGAAVKVQSLTAHRLRLRGGFLSMLAALRVLAEGDDFPVAPLALTMSLPGLDDNARNEDLIFELTLK